MAGERLEYSKDCQGAICPWINPRIGGYNVWWNEDNCQRSERSLTKNCSSKVLKDNVDRNCGETLQSADKSAAIKRSGRT